MASGEEWKGEPAPWQPRSILDALQGPPPTAEERAAFERRRAEALAVGELAGAGLPACGAVRRCPKCGHEKRRTAYCAAEESAQRLWCAARAGAREHLHRQCRSCGYLWIERVLEEDR